MGYNCIVPNWLWFLIKRLCQGGYLANAQAHKRHEHGRLVYKMELAQIEDCMANKIHKTTGRRAVTFTLRQCLALREHAQASGAHNRTGV